MEDMMKKTMYATVIGLMISTAAMAAEINYSAMTDAGFGDVAELLKSMTPEQQEAILKQAAVKQEDLDKLSQEDADKLREQLRATADTIHIDKIDPAKLDVSKTKSTEQIKKDLETYQQKYEKGQIKNSAVKPATN
jgi:hypothetical protein